MEIKKQLNGNTLTMSLEGWLDAESAPVAQKEVEELPQEVTHLIIDCAKMEYISSAGLRMLVYTHKKMSTNGGLVLKNVNDDVRNVLEMSGFMSKLNVE